MHLGRIFIFAFLVIYSALVITVTAGIDFFNFSGSNQVNNNFLQPDQQQLVKLYRKNLNDLFINHSNPSPEVTVNTRVKGFENDLMLLTVPSEFKALHFDLIKGMLLFDQGGQENKAQAKEIMEQVARNYSWLTSNLSIFLINNFN